MTLTSLTVRHIKVLQIRSRNSMWFVSIGGLVVRAEDLWCWLRSVSWVRTPLLATWCVTYIPRSFHITHHFKACVWPWYDLSSVGGVVKQYSFHFHFYVVKMTLFYFTEIYFLVKYLLMWLVWFYGATFINDIVDILVHKC